MASIDVAIPSYNYGRYLRDCVESVLAQDVAALRVLIIDNDSSDDSAKIAQQLASEDARITFVRHPVNLGHQASFNEAIDWASSDYFMILCADDLLTPGSLSRAISVLEQNPDVTLAFGDLAAAMPVPARPATDPPAPWQIMPALDLLEQFCRTGLYSVRSCSAVVRTPVQKRAGYYCAELSHSDDFELMMRLTLLGGRIARTRTPQLFMRAHEQERSSILRRDRSLQILAYEEAFRWFFAHAGAAHPEATRLGRLAARGLVGRAYWSGLSHLCRGEFGNAARLFHYVGSRSWPTAFLPPIDYLFRNDPVTPRSRAGLMSDTVRRLIPASWI